MYALYSFWIIASLIIAEPNALLFNELSEIDPADTVAWHPQGGTREGNQVTLDLRMSPRANFSIYKDNLSFEGPPGSLLTTVDASTTSKILDPISKEEVEVYAHTEFKIVFQTSNLQQDTDFPITVQYVACTEKICLFPYRKELQFSLLIKNSPKKHNSQESSPITSESQESSSDTTWSETLGRKFEEYKDTNLLILLLIIFLAGLATNLTPCVYPMVPLTIRLLSRETGAPFLASLAYAVGIILTYTGLGIIASLTGSLFGGLFASTWVNLLLAGCMLYLSLGSLGIIHISFLQNWGSRIGSTQQGFSKTFLMGVSAGFVASPCTGPVLGALLSLGTSLDSKFTFLLLLVYSLGFGLPYIFLGMISSKLAAIKLPAWAHTAVQVVFSASLISLALYYLQVPFYDAYLSILPYWKYLFTFTLGSSIFPLGWLITRQTRSRFYDIMLSIASALIGVSIFSFLNIPEDPSALHVSDKIIWHSEEVTAFQEANEHNKPVLIDMWAQWCEACKKMDRTTFQSQAVKEELKRWTLLKFDLTAANKKNQTIQQKYQVQGLPLLIIIPDSKKDTEQQQIIGYISAENLLNRLKQLRN